MAQILDPATREANLAYRAQEGGSWEQAHRILGDQRGSFNGLASDDQGIITYSGTRSNGYIWGGYAITYFESAPP